jgi:hypothetical protein
MSSMKGFAFFLLFSALPASLLTGQGFWLVDALAVGVMGGGQSVPPPFNPACHTVAKHQPSRGSR